MMRTGLIAATALAAMLGIGAAPALAASPLVTLRNDATKAKIAPVGDEAVVVVLIDNSHRFPVEILFQRYDVAARKLVVPAKGDKRPYGFSASYAKLRGVAVEVGTYVGVVPAGDYVLLGDRTAEPKTDSFCFAAPVVHVAPGSVTFVGGFRPDGHGSAGNPDQKTSLAWRGDVAAARAAMAEFSALRDRLVVASIDNGATFDCSGDNMWAYRVPGAPDLPPAAPDATSAAPTPATPG